MYPAVLSLCMYSALCVVPDRPAPDEPKTPDVEATWYDQLRRDGRITVNLEGGGIVFVPNGIKDRKLLVVTIMRYDDKKGLIRKSTAKEVVLRFDATKRLLVVAVDHMHSTSVDGTIDVESRIIQFDLPRAR